MDDELLRSNFLLSSFLFYFVKIGFRDIMNVVKLYGIKDKKVKCRN